MLRVELLTVFFELILWTIVAALIIKKYGFIQPSEATLKSTTVS
jgi:hypothetical protein